MSQTNYITNISCMENKNGYCVLSSTANATTAEESYKIARSNYLGCKCQTPAFELYDLGFPRPPSFFDLVLRKFNI